MRKAAGLIARAVATSPDTDQGRATLADIAEEVAALVARFPAYLDDEPTHQARTNPQARTRKPGERNEAGRPARTARSHGFLAPVGAAPAARGR